MIRKEYQEVYSEVLPKDVATITTITSFTESEHKRGVVVLANKLYGMLVDRLEDIDFKEIEQSQGDISKFKYYERTRESISVLKGLAAESGAGKEEVAVIENALSYLEANKLIFTRGFKMDVSFIKYLYNSIVMAIIADIGFMITACVEFIKTPEHTVEMEISNVKKFKSKFYLVHNALQNFNKAVEDGSLEKAVNPLLKVKSEKMVGTVLTIAAIIPLGIIAASITITKVFIPIMRELSYLFYSARVSISNYCILQQKLLEANALKLKARASKDDKSIAREQEKIAAFFSKIGNFFAIKYVSAQNKASKDAANDTKTTISKDEVDSDDEISIF